MSAPGYHYTAQLSAQLSDPVETLGHVCPIDFLTNKQNRTDDFLYSKEIGECREHVIKSVHNRACSFQDTSTLHIEACPAVAMFVITILIQ